MLTYIFMRLYDRSHNKPMTLWLLLSIYIAVPTITIFTQKLNNIIICMSFSLWIPLIMECAKLYKNKILFLHDQ